MIQRRGQPTTDRIGNSLIRDLPSRRCTDWFIEPARPTTSKKTVINIGRRARFRSTPRSEDKAGGVAGDPRIADAGAPYREHRGLNRHIREMALRTGVEAHACIGAARCGPVADSKKPATAPNLLMEVLGPRRPQRQVGRVRLSLVAKFPVCCVTV
jgi:hypothetical protein